MVMRLTMLMSMVITHQNFHDRIYTYSAVDKLTFGNVDYCSPVPFFVTALEDFKQSSYAPHAELPLHQNVDSCLRSVLAYPTTQSPKIWSAFAAVLDDPCFQYLAALQLDCCVAEQVHYQTPITTHLLKIVIQLERSDQP
jgi:hypothetical protein